jgi:PTH1 family peptidyl-tRNA hydrolase
MVHTLVPLGNPGKEYEHTRHNAARIVLSYIRQDIETLSSCEIFVPETFMNESGRAIAEYLRYHNNRELIVIYDDKDLPLGVVRISHDRGDGGHNGVKSIIESLGTREFVRVRVGIARVADDGTVVVPHGEQVQGYVMGKFSDAEEVILQHVSVNVLGALHLIIEQGYQKAMEKYN